MRLDNPAVIAWLVVCLMALLAFASAAHWLWLPAVVLLLILLRSANRRNLRRGTRPRSGA
ncbi:hypothetical protein ABH931_003942 [Streptacidiphilus sp. MAP12-33]